MPEKDRYIITKLSHRFSLLELKFGFMRRSECLKGAGERRFQVRDQVDVLLSRPAQADCRPPGSTAPMARQALHTDGRPSDLSRVLPSARKPRRRAGRAGHHLSAHSTFGSGITKHQRAELDLHPVEGTFQQTSGLKSVPISDGCSPLNVDLVDSTSRPTAALLLVYRERCLSSRILACDRCMRNDAFAARNHVARIRGAVVAKESKLCRRSRGNQRRGRGEQFHKRIRRVLAARSTRPILYRPCANFAESVVSARTKEAWSFRAPGGADSCRPKGCVKIDTRHTGN
ncbi:hypothetical protein FB005_13428 [Sinorhizobium medicae]|nr:hypothetical protein FB006_13328 [Sinorhizobium medicae]TWA35150.1 hypothetical protein FB005_13428 [Sinorhizobium medicae]